MRFYPRRQAADQIYRPSRLIEIHNSIYHSSLAGSTREKCSKIGLGNLGCEWKCLLTTAGSSNEFKRSQGQSSILKMKCFFFPAKMSTMHWHDHRIDVVQVQSKGKQTHSSLNLSKRLNFFFVFPTHQQRRQVALTDAGKAVKLIRSIYLPMCRRA